MHPRRWSRIWWLLIGLLIFLAACGQKGALYHPDDKQAAAGAVINSA